MMVQIMTKKYNDDIAYDKETMMVQRVTKKYNDGIACDKERQ